MALGPLGLGLINPPLAEKNKFIHAFFMHVLSFYVLQIFNFKFK
jgi:hypothetical protein